MWLLCRQKELARRVIETVVIEFVTTRQSIHSCLNPVNRVPHACITAVLEKSSKLILKSTCSCLYSSILFSVQIVAKTPSHRPLSVS